MRLSIKCLPCPNGSIRHWRSAMQALWNVVSVMLTYLVRLIISAAFGYLIAIITSILVLFVFGPERLLEHHFALFFALLTLTSFVVGATYGYGWLWLKMTQAENSNPASISPKFLT